MAPSVRAASRIGAAALVPPSTTALMRSAAASSTRPGCRECRLARTLKLQRALYNVLFTSACSSLQRECLHAMAASGHEPNPDAITPSLWSTCCRLLQDEEQAWAEAHLQGD